MTTDSTQHPPPDRAAAIRAGIERLRAMLNQATPGPWTRDGGRIVGPWEKVDKATGFMSRAKIICDVRDDVPDNDAVILSGSCAVLERALCEANAAMREHDAQVRFSERENTQASECASYSPSQGEHIGRASFHSREAAKALDRAALVLRIATGEEL